MLIYGSFGRDSRMRVDILPCRVVMMSNDSQWQERDEAKELHVALGRQSKIAVYSTG